ncbi:hypothetical protein TB2_014703 [Malus domestica]
MHEMSELLVQNYPNDLDSLDEHKHDRIQHIITNLSMCIQQRPGGKTPISDITLTGTPHYPNKSTVFQMCSYTGFQVTRTKDYQNCYTERKTLRKAMRSFSMGNALRGNHLTTEELDPQAPVYKTLWLDAEAELRSMKLSPVGSGNGMGEADVLDHSPTKPKVTGHGSGPVGTGDWELPSRPNLPILYPLFTIAPVIKSPSLSPSSSF